MEFLKPSYLWALTGLLIPVIIHFWSRKSFKTLPWGMVRFLPEHSTRKAATLHWEDTLLFMIRAFCWFLIVMALAQPFIPRSQDFVRTPKYLIAPELLNNGQVAQILDTLSEEISVQVFTKGFPNIENYQVQDYDSLENYWALLKTLPYESTEKVTVISPARVVNFRGEKPYLNYPVDWLIWPEGSGAEEELTLKTGTWSSKLKGDNIHFVKISDSKASVQIMYNIHVQDKKVKADIELLLDAVNDFVEVESSGEADILFAEDVDSLNQEKTNFLVTDDVPPFRFWPEDSLIKVNPATLQAKNLITYDLVPDFFSILQKRNLLETPSESADVRQLASGQILPGYNTKDKLERSGKNLYLQSYLWLLAILFLIVERIYSVSRR